MGFVEVITKKKLIGTWVAVDEDGKSGKTVCSFIFNNDGSFSYSEITPYESQNSSYSGTWKLNNLGYIIFDKVVGKYHNTKQVLPTVYDKDDKGLWICGSDHTFFYEQMMFYKQD